MSYGENIYPKINNHYKRFFVDNFTFSCFIWFHGYNPFLIIVVNQHATGYNQIEYSLLKYYRKAYCNIASSLSRREGDIRG